jgi:hypothetical protein
LDPSGHEKLCIPNYGSRDEAAEEEAHEISAEEEDREAHKVSADEEGHKALELEISGESGCFVTEI